MIRSIRGKNPRSALLLIFLIALIGGGCEAIGALRFKHITKLDATHRNIKELCYASLSDRC